MRWENFVGAEASAGCDGQAAGGRIIPRRDAKQSDFHLFPLRPTTAERRNHEVGARTPPTSRPCNVGTALGPSDTLRDQRGDGRSFSAQLSTIVTGVTLARGFAALIMTNRPSGATS